MEIRSYIEKFNTGEKVILAGAIFAVLSLFMEWVDIGFASASGFQQQGYIFLAGILYPVWKALKTEKISKKTAYLTVGLSIVLMVYFTSDKTVELFGSSVSMAGTGMYVMIASLLAVLAGIYLNRRQ